jgi:molybdate transport system permease protein
LPNVWGSIFTGAALTFAHTLGEFGVVFMIGGNLPGKTRLASLAIYNEVEAMNYAEANKYALILLVISIVVLLSIQFVKGKLSYAGA